MHLRLANKSAQFTDSKKQSSIRRNKDRTRVLLSELIEYRRGRNPGGLGTQRDEGSRPPENASGTTFRIQQRKMPRENVDRGIVLLSGLV